MPDLHCNAEIDPDNNFDINISNICQYYTDHQFSNFLSDKVFSIMHFNCRCISANFAYFETFVSDLHFKFDVIALSETWLIGNENLNVFHLNGHNFIIRITKVEEVVE